MSSSASSSSIHYDSITRDVLCSTLVVSLFLISWIQQWNLLTTIVSISVAILGFYFGFRTKQLPTGTVLITGGSSGIGLALARKFASKGHDLVLVARDTKSLESAKQQILEQYSSIKVHILSIDLAQSGAANLVFQATQQLKLTISVLVNNAGFGINGSFLSTNVKQDEDMVQVNISALVSLSHIYATQMKAEKRKGWILNVGSTAGFQPGPNMSVYYASKAFVLSFSEALNFELRHYDIFVSCLCPGPVATNFAARANHENSFVFKLIPVETSQSVAEQAYNGLVVREAVIITGMNVLTTTSIRFLPRALVTILAYFLNGKGGH